MATTTNFDWATPDDTDLVKDGASAIRTLGSSIDTSMAGLLGGTTGQTLSKASATDMDFAWADAPSSGGMTLLNSGSTSMSGSATKTISSISGSYNELWIYMYGVTNSVTNSTVYMNVNSDSTSGVYPNTAWWATPGVSGGAFSSENTTYMSLNQFGASYWPNNTNNFTSMQIQGYAGARSKNINYQQGLDGSNKTGLCFYEGTAAITSITITTSSSFTAGTIEIYGVK